MFMHATWTNNPWKVNETTTSKYNKLIDYLLVGKYKPDTKIVTVAVGSM